MYKRYYLNQYLIYVSLKRFFIPNAGKKKNILYISITGCYGSTYWKSLHFTPGK